MESQDTFPRKDEGSDDVIVDIDKRGNVILS